jgi:hypothetical protein
MKVKLIDIINRYKEIKDDPDTDINTEKFKILGQEEWIDTVRLVNLLEEIKNKTIKNENELGNTFDAGAMHVITILKREMGR